MRDIFPCPTPEQSRPPDVIPTIPGRDGYLIPIPEFNNSHEFGPADIVRFFYNFWAVNERPLPRHEHYNHTVNLQPTERSAAVTLQSEYKGLDSKELFARQLHLEAYRALSGRLAAATEQAEQELLRRQIQWTLDAAPDVCGIAGTEFHTVALPAAGESRAYTFLELTVSYPLPKEQESYGLPKKKGDFKAYPWLGAEPSLHMQAHNLPLWQARGDRPPGDFGRAMLLDTLELLKA